MKKLILVCLVLIEGGLAYADIKATYWNLTVDLPRGTTIQVVYTIPPDGNKFRIAGSTYTTYTENYIVPRNFNELGYPFSAAISTQTAHTIIHGTVK